MAINDIIIYIVVPMICGVLFPSVIIAVQFGFKMASKQAKMENDVAVKIAILETKYEHTNSNMKQGFALLDARFEKVDKNIEKLLKYAYQQSARQNDGDDIDNTKFFQQM